MRAGYGVPIPAADSVTDAPRRTPRCATVSHTMADDLSWLPQRGATLTHDELAEVYRTMKALVDATETLSPARAHLVTIATLIARATERALEEDQ